MAINGTPYSGLSPGVLGSPAPQTAENVVGSALVAPSTISHCDAVCAPECESVFDRVLVYHAIRGGSQIEWELKPTFADPAPYTFQLQVGRTGSNLSDDWVDVGSPVVDVFYAVDSDQRIWSNNIWTHYRVKLTTALDTYYSKPEPAWGVLSRLDWRRGREIRRKEELRFRKTPAGTEGYLLKRKIYGERCECIDPMTYECRNPQHADCFGTGIVGGYFTAIPCSYVEFMLRSQRTHRDMTRGTVNDVNVPARMLYWPQINSYDVWVNKSTDERWKIHEVSSIVEIRGIPIAVNVGLRLVPFGDVVYDVPLE